MRNVSWILILALLLLAPPALASPVAAPVAVPDALESWRDWALHGQQQRVLCPLRYGQAPASEAAHACAWPGVLRLEVDSRGARFRIEWQLLSPGSVPLPGDNRHRPLAVRVDDRPAPVTLQRGRPVLLLGAGRHRIEGRFEWQRRPEQLVTPAEIGLIALQVDGAVVAVPQRDEQRLWLGRSVAAAVGEDSLRLRVFRQLSDAVPLHLATELQLEVSGRAREVELGRALPPGFVALSIDSPLVVALGADGSLRAQLRPGSWRVRIDARALEMAERFSAPGNPPPWPDEEIWSFRPQPALRSVQAVGESAVDPNQVGVPWPEAPASFVLGAGDELLIEERSRGLDPERPHRLHLQRDLWLDFDGGGATARDLLNGRLARAGRLDMQAPWQLQRAVASGADLLVTRTADGAGGVELRQLDLDLETLARRASLGGGPLSGWQQDLESMTLDLHLPPGWRLLHAGGADQASTAWTLQWSLLDLFLLAIAALLAQRLLGTVFAVLLLGYLVIGYHEPGAPLWTLLLVLLLGMLLGLLPTGRLARGTSLLRGGILLLALLWALPFAAWQLKLALYPQLERSQVYGADEVVYYDDPQPVEVTMMFEERSPDAMAVRDAPMPPPPPPPPMPAAPPAQSLDRVEVTGARIRSVDVVASTPVDRYPTDAIVQAGPGIPDWSWNRARISWQGPVTAEQTGHLWLSPPWLTRTLRLLSVLLLFAALLKLVQSVRRPPARPRPVVTTAAALGCLLLLATPLVQAGGFPPQPLLDQLRERLLAPAPCAPACASVASADVQLDGDRLRVALEMHAAVDSAVPLPDAGTAAAITALRLGGESAPLLRLDAVPLLRLPRGVHRVEIEWQLAVGDSIDLRFPLPPARTVVLAEGWEVGGMQEGRLLGDTLQLLRSAGSATEAASAVQEFPPFVRVSRTLQLGLDWQVVTEVQRMAPARAGFTVAVPLLPGERVLDDSREIIDGHLQVAFAAGQPSVGWRSQLEIGERIELQAGDLARFAERWRVEVGPFWHASFAGVPELAQDDAGGARSFQPLPGELLTIDISRPAAVPGASVAIDAASLRWLPGERASDGHLELDLRSTRGGPHPIGLPAEAELVAVTLRGQSLNLRISDGQVVLPLLPGEQQLQLHWREPRGIGLMTRSPEVALGAATANLQLHLDLPDSRWLLATFGEGIGPAVLIWPQLLLMILLAAALARMATPLRFHHWLLLGLGFSTVSWLAATVVVGWLLLLGWRGRQTGLDSGPRWRFAILQLLLVLLTFAAAFALVVAVQQGLLGRPDMQVVGNGASSWYGSLSWFLDRSDGKLPAVAALSLPGWLYKVAILAWALWLANALIGWLRWGWQSWSSGGYWPTPRRKPVVATASDADTAGPDAS